MRDAVASLPLTRAIVVLVALACAACATPAADAPGIPSKEPPTAKSEQEVAKASPAAEAVKEPSLDLPKKPPPSRAALELDKGVKSYEDGAYKIAARQFQNALDYGLETRNDQAKAHKYLAFIACVSGQKKSCRSEFRKAFDADPKFELDPAEAGQPIWGPIFRSVKAEQIVKAKAK